MSNKVQIRWITKSIFFFLLVVSLCISSQVQCAQRFSLGGTVFEEAAQLEGVDPLLLYAVAYISSGKTAANGNSRPYPYAVTYDGKAFYPETESEAWEIVRNRFDTSDNVSIGLMQINILHNPQPYPREMLNPKKNLIAGAKILRKMMDSTDDPIIGVGKFFYPSDTASARLFGRKVWAIRANLESINARPIEIQVAKLQQDGELNHDISGAQKIRRESLIK